MSVIITLTINTGSGMLDVSVIHIDNMHAVACDISNIYTDDHH